MKDDERMNRAYVPCGTILSVIVPMGEITETRYVIRMVGKPNV